MAEWIEDCGFDGDYRCQKWRINLVLVNPFVSPENQKEKKTIGCNFLMALVNQLGGGGGSIMLLLLLSSCCVLTLGVFFFFFLALLLLEMCSCLLSSELKCS
jgi:hypothetical protein